jgi:hypothetical protein
MVKGGLIGGRTDEAAKVRMWLGAKRHTGEKPPHRDVHIEATRINELNEQISDRDADAT